MEKIIRLNAVELVPKNVANYLSKVTPVTETLREIVTNHHKTFSKTPQGAITKQKARRLQPPSTLLDLVQLNSQALFATVVIWAWTGKIAEVAHAPRNTMITLMAWTHLIVPTAAAMSTTGVAAAPVETQVAPTKSPKFLFWRKLAAKFSLLSPGKRTKLPAKIAATTNLFKNTKTKLKRQKNLKLSKHLRTWEISVCVC